MKHDEKVTVEVEVTRLLAEPGGWSAYSANLAEKGFYAGSELVDAFTEALVKREQEHFIFYAHDTGIDLPFEAKIDYLGANWYEVTNPAELGLTNYKLVEKPEFKVGDKVTVTGDTGRWCHQFNAGDVGTVTSTERRRAGNYRAGSDGYTVSCPTTSGWIKEWDVCVDDLTPAPQGPKFKVGDKVRYVSNGKPVDSISGLVVQGVRKNGKYEAEGRCDGRFYIGLFNEDWLELRPCEAGETVKPEELSNGMMVRVEERNTDSRSGTRVRITEGVVEGCRPNRNTVRVGGYVVQVASVPHDVTITFLGQAEGRAA